jgi:hypothetical protein
MLVFATIIPELMKRIGIINLADVSRASNNVGNWS